MGHFFVAREALAEKEEPLVTYVAADGKKWCEELGKESIVFERIVGLLRSFSNRLLSYAVAILTGAKQHIKWRHF
jgi:hypothetical protein